MSKGECQVVQQVLVRERELLVDHLAGVLARLTPINDEVMAEITWHARQPRIAPDGPSWEPRNRPPAPGGPGPQLFEGTSGPQRPTIRVS